MSSEIKVKRICEYCQKEFVARTTVTRYCSHKCNSRHYKQKQKQKKIQSSNQETNHNKNEKIDHLKAKDFLTVREASKILNCSRQNVYKMINAGKLPATNLLERKTLVRRYDIDHLFHTPEPVRTIKKPERIEYELTDCYTISEIQDKYGISEKALHDIITRNNLPKLKIGWYAYVPKELIDELLQ